MAGLSHSFDCFTSKLKAARTALPRSRHIAEADRVVVFTTVRGKLKDGRVYKNDIVFLFVIADGKFSAVTEFPNSAKSRAFWLGK